MPFLSSSLTRRRTLVAISVAVIVMVFIGLVAFPEKSIQKALSIAGVEDARFDDLEWSADGAVLTNLNLPSQGIFLAKVVIETSPGKLSAGRFDKVTLHDWRYTPISQASDSGKTKKPFDLRASLQNLDIHVDQVVLNPGQVNLGGDLPALQVSGLLSDAGATYTAEIEVNTPEDQSRLNLSAQLNATLEKKTGLLKARFETAGATADLPQIKIENFSGWAGVETSADAALPLISADVSADKIDFSGFSFTSLQLTGDAGANGQALNLAMMLDGQQYSMDLPVLRVSPVSYGGGFKIALSEASLKTPQAVVSGIDTDLELGLTPYPFAAGHVNIAEIASTARPAYFSPLKLQATLASLSAQPNTTGIDATVTAQAGALMVKAQGFHNSEKKNGRLRVRLEPLELMTGISTLDEFFPFIDTYLTDVTGSFGAFGGINWQHDGTTWTKTSRGQIKLENISGAYGGDFPFTGLTTVLSFDSLIPLSFSQQKVAIGAFTAGLPLQNGLVTLSLKDGKSLTLHDGRMDMAGGNITVAPFTLDLAKRTGRIKLDATGLDLEKLFAIAPMEGLIATGTVNGTLPLQLTSAGIRLDNGVLQSTGPGVLKYAPQELPAFLSDDTNVHMTTLRTAIANFHFSNLRMGLSGNLLGDQTITLTIEGKNPDFYGGHPVKFNLNVEGPLQNILRYAPGTSTIPDTIEKQLEQFEENNDL